MFVGGDGVSIQSLNQTRGRYEYFPEQHIGFQGKDDPS